MTANYVLNQALMKGGAKAKRTPSKPPRKPRLDGGVSGRDVQEPARAGIIIWSLFGY